jgi:hypothetical protein
LEAERTLVKQAASRYAMPAESNYRSGLVVEKIKDELHKTVEAKRKLLERNFINFRFDEYKNPQAVNQLEEIERKMAGKE